MCEEIANKDKEQILGCGKNDLGSVPAVKIYSLQFRGMIFNVVMPGGREIRYKLF